jgi:hypothetical protein
MRNPARIVHEKTKDPGRIKTEWLGAEACVPLLPRLAAGARFMLWSRRLPARVVLSSFSSGLAMGGCLALFACGWFGSRLCRAGQGK